MKRLVAALVITLALVLVVPTPALAGKDGRIRWLVPNWAAGVQMATSYPTAADPYLHARFKRVSGEGQRQVRMGERHKLPSSHRWGPYEYTKAVKLKVGEKVVFTTKASLPCEPAVEPIGITVDMRIKKPGKAWSRWETWITDDQRLLDCNEVLP